MKPPLSSSEAIRTVLILALSLLLGWNGYRLVHREAVLPAMLALLVMLVMGMLRLSTDRNRLPLWRRVLPLILCVLGLLAAAKVGSLVDRLDFRYRRQMHYRQVVEMLKRGEILSQSTAVATVGLPHPYENEANWAEVRRDSKAGLRVEFRWTRHSSYVYCKEDACAVDPRWNHHERINGEWLFVRD